MAGKRSSTAKNTDESLAKAQEEKEKKKERKRQKLDARAKKNRPDAHESDSESEQLETLQQRKRKKSDVAKKSRHDAQDSDSESEEDPKISHQNPKKLNQTSVKLQQYELENAKLRAELKAARRAGSPKNSEDDDTDFSDDVIITDEVDEEQSWSRQKIKRHVKKYGIVTLNNDMKKEIFRLAEQNLFRTVKFIPNENCIKPAWNDHVPPRTK